MRIDPLFIFSPKRAARACSLSLCLYALVAYPAFGADSAAVATAERPVRAIWVEANADAIGSPEACRLLIDRLRDLHVDDVFLEILAQGAACYRSDLVRPWPGLLRPDFDPLECLIREAHREGERTLRLHGAVDLLRLAGEEGEGNDTALLQRDIQGRMRDEAGASWLDPALPAVGQRLGAVVSELAGRYALDGIDFAHWRYPGLAMDWGYGPASLQLYDQGKSAGGAPAPSDNAWVQWRAERLSSLLALLAQGARQARPGLIVSAGAIATGGVPTDATQEMPQFLLALQDWPAWGEQGIVDWIVLQAYQDNSEAPGQFLGWIELAKQCRGTAKLIVAVGGAQNGDSGVVMQLRQGLDCEVDGILLNSYQHPTRTSNAETDILAYIGQTVFSPDYVLPSSVQSVLGAVATPDAPESADAAASSADAGPEPTPVLELVSGALPASESEELPPPLPLSEESPVEPPPSQTVQSAQRRRPEASQRQTRSGDVKSQADVTRALLGWKTSKKPNAKTQATADEKRLLEERIRQYAEQQEVDWSIVRLQRGGVLVGEVLSRDEVSIVVRVRESGVKMRLPATYVTRIAKLSEV